VQRNMVPLSVNRIEEVLVEVMGGIQSAVVSSKVGRGF
jgi:hypothetical protein